MKLLIAAFAVVLFEGYVFLNHSNNNTIIDAAAARQKALQYKQKFTIGCAANIASFNPEDPSNIIPLLDGWGHYSMPVTATNDSSRIYFEQGINMYYGF